MKKIIQSLAVAGIALFVISSCSKEVKEEPLTDDISQATLDRISSLGFSKNEVKKVDEGYLVEGDIILTDQDLRQPTNSPTLRIANVEQYRTNNLVTSLPRTITVSSTSSNANLIAAIDGAIARYNAENLQLNFQRVASGGNIVVRVVNTRQYIASAGFPSGGNPYNTVNYAKAYLNYSSGFMTTVLAHEMGHCIGFRHTDYMDRSYSCGGAYSNEGASTVGAVHIPGTPTTADPNSWMLACLSATTNRPFNANDKIALDYLY
jgi:hypothetical protein